MTPPAGSDATRDAASARTTWSRPPIFFTIPAARYAFWFAIAAYLVWSSNTLNIDWVRTAQGLPRAGDMLARMVPPDFSRSGLLIRGVVESVQMAFLSARNTTPNWITWFIGRFILVSSRSINTIVWALIFVAIFGPGAMAGIWAIAFRSIGFMGKLIAEAIEEVDEGTVEAIETTEASRLKVLLIGVLPQVLPVIFGTTMYCWDINIRESTVLGFVGAGGIGIELYSSINLFRWPEVSVMVFAILLVVVISEFVSAAARQKSLKDFRHSRVLSPS